MSNLLKIGITIGDINGIGMEVIIKTFMDNRMMEICTPIVYGSSKLSSYHRKLLDITNFSFNIVKDTDQINPKRANIINCWEEDVIIDIGKSTKIAGKYALLSLEAATNDLLNHKIDALVTAPINKDNIHSEQFNFIGHTSYLSNKANGITPLMFLVHNDTRIGVVTDHIPIKDISLSLSQELVLEKILIMNKSLINDFRIRRPKIAVLGLNPHAGDNGLIGDEDKTILLPAIQKAIEQELIVFGPYAADGFFGTNAYKAFDGILAQYHDQGLIPFKMNSFEEGVNYTAGLPFVRTSPDHGTAYEIAGKNIASETSFRNAIYLACDIFKNRKKLKEWSLNPVPYSTNNDNNN